MMMVLRSLQEWLTAHVFIICEICRVEVDIVAVAEYEKQCEKNGWTKKNEYNVNAPVGKRYKLFHWCPRCSLELQNKLRGEIT